MSDGHLGVVAIDGERTFDVRKIALGRGGLLVTIDIPGDVANAIPSGDVGWVLYGADEVCVIVGRTTIRDAGDTFNPACTVTHTHHITYVDKMSERAKEVMGYG